MKNKSQIEQELTFGEKRKHGEPSEIIYLSQSRERIIFPFYLNKKRINIVNPKYARKYE